MYSVEVAHIYQDESLDINYIQSLKESISIVQSLGIENYSLKILVDDLHVQKNKIWQLQDLLNILSSENIHIDHIAFESAFQFSHHQALKFIDSKNLSWQTFRKENKRCLFYKDGEMRFSIKTENENSSTYTCTFLSFCWHLCRLGLIQYPQNSILSLNDNKETSCDNTLTILDKKYQVIEERVQRLLNNVVSSEKINYHYF